MCVNLSLEIYSQFGEYMIIEPNLFGF